MPTPPPTLLLSRTVRKQINFTIPFHIRSFAHTTHTTHTHGSFLFGARTGANASRCPFAFRLNCFSSVIFLPPFPHQRNLLRRQEGTARSDSSSFAPRPPPLLAEPEPG
ncbi:AGAP013245-PA [Anopheles gambiae str. PEST]|uniref:AGAP013245-PA n=1 Tax=Anopheles gambiae TaxID=7165 RepID=F5HK81_ANOGA|nr:AGAP013245-PA [Anopheles gambiae str. PEST]